MSYAELHCLTNFSFLRGASHPEELVERAHALGYGALAITDECSVAGVVRAHIAATKCNASDDVENRRRPPFKLIIGTEVTFGNGLKLVLLAPDRASYGEMCALITKARMRTVKGKYCLETGDLDQDLGNCLALLVPGATPDPGHARLVAQRFEHRAWIAAELVCGANDAARLAALRELASASALPLVAAGDVHMHVRSRRRMQDVLTAIRLGTPVACAGDALFPNAERHLRSRLRLARIYPPELLREAVSIAERCSFDLDTLRYEYP